MYGNLKSGRKVVAVAGTAVPLAAAASISGRVIITALMTNTGVVAIGDASAKATAGSEMGVLLKATSGTLELLQEDLSKIYIDATVNGEGVTFTYEY